MISNYTPIELVKRNTENSFQDVKRICANFRVKNVDKLTVNVLIDDLADDYHKSKFPDVEQFLYKVFINSMQTQDPNFISSIESKNSSLRTEFKDVFLFPILLNEWAKSKQVFKPDPDFADALLHTDKLCVSRSMIEHLPYNLFYIDTSDCETFKPIDGLFVYVKSYGEVASFCLYSITNNLTYFSFYLTVSYDEHCCISIDFDKFGVAKYDAYIPSLFRTDSVEKDVTRLVVNDSDLKISRADVYAFAIQLIAYLSIEEPQLTDSDLTKGTYRAPSACSKVRNKWSEVRIQDVGVKYGSDFRKTYTSQPTNEYENTGKRKSPIPHFRCAHWHKFWVGEGRKQLVLKWIAPVFVGNGDNKNVIIHKVKED